MLLLALGLLAFFGAHLVPIEAGLRRGLVDRFSEGAVKAGVALVSFAGLALIILGWMKLGSHPGKNPILWTPPLWTHYIPIVLMLPAFILLVAAYVPSRIGPAVKHPMLTAVKLWAFGHLCANGDLASVLLFGSFLAYAVYDRISVKRRGMLPKVWPKAGFANDLVVMGLGTALYLLFLFWAHEALFGVSPLPT